MPSSPSPPWPHTAVLLAGGRSQRMGLDKHGLQVPNGKTLLEIVRDCAQLTASRVIISGPAEAMPQLEHIADIRPASGPLGGIESVIKSGRDERYLFLPCDMPRLTPSLLRRLVEKLDHAEAVVFEQGERSIRPVLPLALRSKTAARVQQLMEHGRASIHELIESLDAATVPLGEEESGCLLNINTPEEWSEFLAEG